MRMNPFCIIGFGSPSTRSFQNGTSEPSISLGLNSSSPARLTVCLLLHNRSTLGYASKSWSTGCFESKCVVNRAREAYDAQARGRNPQNRLGQGSGEIKRQSLETADFRLKRV